VYGNLMVNVQPRNTKLVDRACRIIASAAGVSADRAAELLEASGRNVRVAILMSRANLDRKTAEERLSAANGRISDALRDN
jgi:N-acetylmuramic acid 6-phosphate etherase